MTTDTKIRIAIIGGGIAGATLANAFIRIPHLDVHLYESAPEFSERGAAVALAVNAQTALKETIPHSESLLKRAGAMTMNSTRRNRPPSLPPPRATSPFTCYPPPRGQETNHHQPAPRRQKQHPAHLPRRNQRGFPRCHRRRWNIQLCSQAPPPRSA